MENLLNFDEYLFNSVFESNSSEELILMISDKLDDLLHMIDHPIAEDLLKKVNNIDHGYKITFLDIDDSNYDKKDMISFLSSNKVFDLTSKELGTTLDRKTGISDYELNTLKDYIYKRNRSSEFYDNKMRSSTKLGRIITKLFPKKYKDSGDPGNDIESFVNMYKSFRDEGLFEIVSGDDIRDWYNVDRYMDGNGPLNSSCMRYDHCKDYLKLYSKNEEKVSLLILKDVYNKDHIRGRAILWKLDEPSGRTFMDRIYTVYDSDVYLFKEYAKDKGWLYKSYQNMNEDVEIVDTKTGEEDNMDLIVYNMYDPGDGHYPYMDTMKYFDGDTISNSESNVSDDYKYLEDTSGSYDNRGEWSDFYNQYIDTDSGYYTYCDYGDGWREDGDFYYSDYYNVYIANDYAEDNMVEMDNYTDYHDKYRLDGDYITTYEGNTADTNYADNNFQYSQYYNEYLEEPVWSDYISDWIPEQESVEVYTNVSETMTDYRIDNSSDGDWWEWDYNNDKYSNDITEEELREEYGLDEDED